MGAGGALGASGSGCGRVDREKNVRHASPTSFLSVSCARAPWGAISPFNRGGGVHSGARPPALRGRGRAVWGGLAPQGPNGPAERGQFMVA
jgi:hypothetical protein